MVATLDIAVEIRPLANINIESKRSWYPIDDELPRFDSSPSPGEFAHLRSTAK